MDAASPHSVPVTTGSPEFRTLDLDWFSVTEAWFPPGEILARHFHDRACFAVMIAGSFDLAFTGQTHACPPGTVVTEPAGESHTNFIQQGGARVVVVQPDPCRAELLEPFGPLLDQIHHLRHAGIAATAARLAREILQPDSLARIAVEAAVLDMFVTAARLAECGTRPAPRWLKRCQELLHSRFTEPLRLSELAAEADVHPAHLTRVFRTQFGVSVGVYLRQLRLEWAARELIRPGGSLAGIAAAAGFADQSHFTRAFKRHTGMTPARYRQSALS